MENNIASVSFEKIKKMIEKMNKDFSDDDEISFELLIGSLFPNIMDNIRDFGTQKYIEGRNSVK